MKSTFTSDLEKERKLSVLLDATYMKHLKYYSFERIHEKNRQFEGVDVVFTHSETRNTFLIDEKAQLDYLNEELPTFAFELAYLKNGVEKRGWLFNPRKSTDFYSLVTSIYCDEPNTYTTCKITFVNRQKLIALLSSRKYTFKSLEKILQLHKKSNGMVVLDQLNSRTEGYLYFSNKRKAEKPVNLVLKLDFLIKAGVAKRLV